MGKIIGNKVSLMIIIVAIALLLLVPGCAVEEKAWKTAVEENTIASYEEYLEEYPEGEYSREAKEAIDELAWQAAKKVNTVEIYEDYLEEYPEGEYSREAKGAIDELAWQAAKKVNTVEIYDDYLDVYPGGRYAEQAKEKLPPFELLSAKRALSFDYRGRIKTPKGSGNVVLVLEFSSDYDRFGGPELDVEKNYVMAKNRKWPFYLLGVYPVEEEFIIVAVVPQGNRVFDLFIEDFAVVTFEAEEKIYDQIGFKDSPFFVMELFVAQDKTPW